ncbi:hypothetical protein THAOC_22520 [Thalassiosira oceanica]|uniref:Uncharacterized protein n=1 Tax=Thalassiosira oceanica TaxID=159749 RepID=K0RWR0_THAOC|nr:hypothetical protein THAOC_22520 [Thalassiosira oceanica]|eukprot:EJK57435.1 hypothetical protein THAOC_22520 [Thalassiosira oceanica]
MGALDWPSRLVYLRFVALYRGVAIWVRSVSKGLARAKPARVGPEKGAIRGAATKREDDCGGQGRVPVSSTGRALGDRSAPPASGEGDFYALHLPTARRVKESRQKRRRRCDSAATIPNSADDDGADAVSPRRGLERASGRLEAAIGRE